VNSALAAIEACYKNNHDTFGLDRGFNVEDHDHNEERKVKTQEMAVKFLVWQRDEMVIKTNIQKNERIRQAPGQQKDRMQ
jgi:hypothetical protein